MLDSEERRTENVNVYSSKLAWNLAMRSRAGPDNPVVLTLAVSQEER